MLVSLGVVAPMSRVRDAESSDSPVVVQPPSRSHFDRSDTAASGPHQSWQQREPQQLRLLQPQRLVHHSDGSGSASRGAGRAAEQRLHSESTIAIDEDALYDRDDEDEDDDDDGGSELQLQRQHPPLFQPSYHHHARAAQVANGHQVNGRPPAASQLQPLVGPAGSSGVIAQRAANGGDAKLDRATETTRLLPPSAAPRLTPASYSQGAALSAVQKVDVGPSPSPSPAAAAASPLRLAVYLVLSVLIAAGNGVTWKRTLNRFRSTDGSFASLEFFVTQWTILLYVALAGALLLYRWLCTDLITDNQKRYPQRKFALMGLMDSVAGLCSSLGGAFTSGQVQTIIQQGHTRSRRAARR